MTVSPLEEKLYFSNERTATKKLASIKRGETLVAFKDGKPAMHPLRSRGTMIRLTPEQYAPLQGALIMHNHPRGTSFSFADVELLAKSQAAEIRAISDRYIYSLEQRGHPIDLQELRNRFNTEYVNLLPDDSMVKDDLILHKVWLQLSRDENNGIIYHRTLRIGE